MSVPKTFFCISKKFSQVENNHHYRYYLSVNKLLFLAKKLIPRKLFAALQPIYHYKLALAGALIYRFPSRKIKVIGVTGTKGKSSVVEILAAILEEAGYKAASASTVRFKIGNRSRPNLFKMTMPGRFFTQKFLRQAVDAKCDFAILEITSEGARQYRHKFINLDALIFTNLAPEHIESHGGYEKYREAKLKIARALSKSTKNPKFIIANTDDKEAEKFFEAAGCRAEVRPETGLTCFKVPYSLKDAGPYRLSDDGIEFNFDGQKIVSPLRGKFNIYNTLAAATATRAFGIPPEKIKLAVEKLKEIPGRAQSVKNDLGFDIVVDYAHTPDSLRALYETFPNKRRVCVLGNTGGGRDTWKRPAMGKVAEDFCDKIILTNEDPYDENPRKIVEEMAAAIRPEKLTIEMDRRKAISLAIKKAKEMLGALNPPAGGLGSRNQNKVAVLISGKGTDPYIMEANGKKTPWDDKRVVEEELRKQQLVILDRFAK
jgi:UDP-N-acetylmuramoyl-L-alanyl-D-glutamate--2,6-diaminopimelate ligase